MTRESKSPKISDSLDIRLDICPMTFVKTKLALEDLQPGQCLEVFLREGEPLHNVTRSCEEEGHKVLERARDEGEYWRLVIVRGEDI